ncbi:OsmC family protein [Plantactinospora sp. WMMB334]|uniref:OsmC family protein n=1 Tax=Plantactinospora sp. WMMB334 TaxID=3404119 RepID=UPI003B938354
MVQVQAAARTGNATTLDVRFVAGESYEFVVRGHRLLVDQPVEAGGGDEAPTPTELFVASLASCVAFYAGRYLSRHRLSRDGLGVSATFRMAADKAARVAEVQLTVRVPPDFPEARRQALLAVVSHCTVHNSLASPPAVSIDLATP